MSDLQLLSGGSGPLEDLNVEIEVTKATGTLSSYEASHQAAALISQCILGSIQQQSPQLRKCIYDILDGKTFVVVIEKRRTFNGRVSTNVNE